MNEEGVIYVWTNRVNGKQYVGQAKDWDRRLKAHMNCIDSGCPDCTSLLHRAINAYGIESFETELLETGLTDRDLDTQERFYIASLRTLSPNGYNLLAGENNLECANEKYLRILDYLPMQNIEEQIEIENALYRAAGEDWNPII